MKNYEKYADEIKQYKGYDFCRNFVLPRVLKSSDCLNNNDLQCSSCHMKQMIWLFEECEESEGPKTDWSKVEVDTPILVRDYEDQGWKRRHFAKYEDGVVYTWSDGRTSWNEVVVIGWNFAKLAEGEESDG